MNHKRFTFRSNASENNPKFLCHNTRAYHFEHVEMDAIIVVIIAVVASQALSSPRPPGEATQQQLCLLWRSLGSA